MYITTWVIFVMSAMVQEHRLEEEKYPHGELSTSQFAILLLFRFGLVWKAVGETPWSFELGRLE